MEGEKNRSHTINLESVPVEARMQQNIVFTSQRGNYFSLDIYSDKLSIKCRIEQKKKMIAKSMVSKIYFPSQNNKRMYPSKRGSKPRKGISDMQETEDPTQEGGKGPKEQLFSRTRKELVQKESREGEKRTGIDYLMFFTTGEGFYNFLECLGKINNM